MSPIKGLSEKKRLPRLGKIHLGVKKTKEVNGQTIEFPSATDYFVFPQDNALFSELVRIFGEQPKELRILIPTEDEERWCSQYYRAYSRTRGLLCRGDGENAICMVDTKTGEIAAHDSKEVAMKPVTCKGRDCPAYGEYCREIMNLQFMLPEVPGLGIWQIDTSSINSIKNINSEADLIKQVYKHIAMVPLLLTLEPQSVQDEDGKKRTVHVLNLRTNQTLIQMMEKMAKPIPEMLTYREEDMPEPDDEVPELIIPQVQEERVTAEAQGVKPQTKTRRSASTKQKNKVTPPPEAATAEIQPNTEPQPSHTPAAAVMKPPDDPVATQEEKREIIAALRAKGLSDPEIRDKFQTVTGKKGGWLKSDIEKLRQEVNKEQKSPDELADELLKSMEG